MKRRKDEGGETSFGGTRKDHPLSSSKDYLRTRMYGQKYVR